LGRSDNGFIESKCGRFQIIPFWWGRCTPQEYVVKYNKNNEKIKIRSGCDTQKEAKQYLVKIRKHIYDRRQLR